MAQRAAATAPPSRRAPGRIADRAHEASDIEPGAGAGSVELCGVTKRYGEAVAVDDVSMLVEAGEFVSLLGPSGCGKTTTLRMIAGFEHPDAGDIRISGASVLGTRPYERDVNTVFQAYALFPHMTVGENVAYGLQQARISRSETLERVAAALEMVRMRRFADRSPAQLSGGQQQRVAVARALVNRPAVLLLDEPLGALDRQLREEMQLELKLLQGRLGITFVFVTHDQSEALSMSDRIAVMRDGRIEQLADADTIYTAPASAYVAAFVGQQNFLTGTVTSDGAALATATAIVTALAPPPSRPGDAAQAAIRPEFITVEPRGDASAPVGGVRAGSDASGVDSVNGRIVSVARLGETVQFLVGLDDGVNLLVRRPTPSAPRLSPGDPVTCSWMPDDVLFFPTDADPARSDPTDADAARSDPARSDPARSDPARSDPARSDPAQNARSDHAPGKEKP